MPIGKYKFFRQFSDTAMFGDIEIETTVSTVGGIDIVSMPEEIPRVWKLSIHAGIEYAYEKIFFQVSHGFNVQVKNLRWMTVDTTSMVVFFISTQAFWIAAGYEPKESAFFDKDKRLFCFP